MAGEGELKSSGNVMVVIELPGSVSVLEMVKTVEASVFSPVI